MEALKGFRDRFTAVGICGAGRLNDGKRFTAEGECERLAGVANLFEEAEATGFELGYLESFYKRDSMWSNEVVKLAFRP